MEDEQLKRLQQQFDFFLAIDKEKEIIRQTPIADGTRKENDAEHAWHMAVMTLLLSEYANEEIDRLRTVSMIIVHDLVEVYAGDTFAYDEDAKKSQKERELAAADKLFSKLPDDQAEYMRGLWEEFEAEITPEAKFARTMDNIQPMMLNNATDGISWREHDVKLSQVLKRNEHTADGSEVLWEYAYENWLLPNTEKGNLKNE